MIKNTGQAQLATLACFRFIFMFGDQFLFSHYLLASSKEKVLLIVPASACESICKYNFAYIEDI